VREAPRTIDHHRHEIAQRAIADLARDDVSDRTVDEVVGDDRTTSEATAPAGARLLLTFTRDEGR
jgi:hypothetical protein